MAREFGAPEDSQTRVLVVADHPAADRGFATVGRHVALALQASGMWDVHYLARFGEADGRQFPFPIYSTERTGTGEEAEAEVFPVLAARLARDLPANQRVLLVVVIGGAMQQSALLRASLIAGLRSRLHFAAYLPVDFAPLPVACAGLFRAVDSLIPYTRMGARAIERCCASAGMTPGRPMRVIPHGVDVSLFRPPVPAARATARATYCQATPTSFVVGFFGRNSSHKRVDLALRIFRIFAQGRYSVCRACGSTTIDAFEPISYGYETVGHCRHCGSKRIARGRRRPSARLMLHAEVLGIDGQRLAGGWDLVALVKLMGLESQVVLHHGLRIGRGVPATELALRMGACDVHLLPYDAGGWELTVLETGACGVPNVITDTGATPEYGRPFAVVVRVGAYNTQQRGDVRGLIDEEAAVAALVRLAGSARERRRLGRAGVEVAAAHSWTRVGASWLETLGAIDLTRTTSRPGLMAIGPLITRRPSRTLMNAPGFPSLP